MIVKRKFEDVEITFKLTDDEIVEAIAKKTIDERTTFFRKLLQTDIKNTFTFKFITDLLK